LKRRLAVVWLGAVVVLFPASGMLSAQEEQSAAQPPGLTKGWVAGGALFEMKCAKCHGNADTTTRTVSREGLKKMSSEAIYAAVTSGSMAAQAKDLTDGQMRAIAQHLGGRPVGIAAEGDAKTMSNRCAANPPLPDPASGAAWNGWSNDFNNSRFQNAQSASLSASDVPRLKLKWAFGVPGAAEMYSQPTIVSGRVFIGADTGYVYSLEAATGCVYWSFLAQAGVRTAPSIGPAKATDGTKYAVYFGDTRSNAYAVDAATGELIWKERVEEHPESRIVGAPKLYQGRLYVPVSSGEEGTSANPAYECCTFRGSLVALDASTGKQVWKTYTITEAVKPTKKNPVGTQLYGPAGGAIWNSPTIDEKRHVLYVGTGDAYTEPAARNTDAILAVDLDSGKIVWSMQDIKNDAWIVGCDEKKPAGNCPGDLGPDYDFSVSPMLRTLPNGKQVLVVSGKSGYALGLDPDKKGAVMWKTPLFEKPPIFTGLVVFGGAADEQAAYYPLNQVGGIAALYPATGERKWFTPLAPADIPNEPPRPGQSAAVTAIPGAVFSGGWDGRLRAVSSEDGHVIWEYNTVRDYETVNGVPARGGSMGAPGATVVGGKLFVTSGYVGVSKGLPGNVLLAFAPE
jgi:polyvinyl alcohol dehydrogenase (cytochrome)